VERYGRDIFMHFPALARNGPPTSFHLTSPKDFDVEKGVAYLILNKFKADKLVSTGMPRPVTQAEVVQLMAGVAGCGHPTTWVREEDDAWDADDLLDSFAPKIKLEPNHESHNGGKLKRALFHHNEMDEDDFNLKADSESEIDFGDDDNERFSSSASSSSSSAMSTTPAAQKGKAGKRLRKNQ
jgi:hypothetical protein